MTIFSRQEMERRWGKLQGGLAKAGIDCAIATSYAGSYYLSGSPIHPFGRPLATLVPVEGPPAIVQSIIEKEHTQAQSCIEDIRTYYDFNIEPVLENPQPPLASMLQLIRQALAQRRLEGGRIGVEGRHIPLAHYEGLRSLLPEATFVDISDMLERQRLTLSGEELALIRAADAVADLGQGRLIEILEPGKSAHELTEEIRQVMMDEILTRHPDKPFVIHAGAGLGCAGKVAGHSEWTTWNRETLVQENTLLETVISVWLWGYWGNVERAVWVGRPNPEVQRGFDIMVEANEAAIAAIRPGLPLAQVDRICKEVFWKHGFTTMSGSGCGRGITSYEANSRELRMDVRLYSDVILEAGMAFSLEPDLRLPGIGVFRHCNTIIVTEDGCEVDSRLPRGAIYV